MVSMGLLKRRASLKASGRLGSNLPVSMALTDWRETSRRLGEVGLAPVALGAEDAESVFHRYLMRMKGCEIPLKIQKKT